VDPRNGTVCSDPCNGDADCPDPPSGTATPWCGSITDHCVLLCGVSEGTCPDGMACVPGGAVQVCAWPAT
jgi:hypothetical protein